MKPEQQLQRNSLRFGQKLHFRFRSNKKNKSSNKNFAINGQNMGKKPS
jgi:hypothetical protein